MKHYEIVKFEDDSIGQGFELFYLGQHVGTTGSMSILRKWAREMWRTDKKHLTYFDYLVLHAENVGHFFGPAEIAAIGDGEFTKTYRCVDCGEWIEGIFSNGTREGETGGEYLGSGVSDGALRRCEVPRNEN